MINHFTDMAKVTTFQAHMSRESTFVLTYQIHCIIKNKVVVVVLALGVQCQCRRETILIVNMTWGVIKKNTIYLHMLQNKNTVI